jgi:hypothetical protein
MENHKKFKESLKFIVQKEFFPVYAPSIKCFIFKSRGKSAKNKPIDFSDDEKELIVNGVIKMALKMKNDFEKSKKKKLEKLEKEKLKELK